ncbi:hypothetical protein CORC01_06647 [Colletotrichum orchidophilum]|uniref:Uncharacterized protein n=1 Tax=Colletotrichum orchidophilum TaxID=1209926 RepID=A0A1G4B982_9PEZI|nr:uncharacterized protein CORC01_06647 [Colletotrichum orchidophilum]OHE97978.1 hypothetical protein CORC01_06647 [Colletotrichum orchidophilum]
MLSSAWTGGARGDRGRLPIWSAGLQRRFVLPWVTP